MTIRRPAAATPSRIAPADPNISAIIGVESSILPAHASVSDAITRLQWERDLALRRIYELHVHYKRELKKKDDYQHTLNQAHI
jgi:hypothetical protein